MQKKTLIQLITGVVAAGLVVVLAFFLIAPMLSPDNSTAPEDSETSESADSSTQETADEEELEEIRQALKDIARRDANDPRALGDVDAPVVMIVFSDYRCPYCTMFGRDTLPTLIEEYVKTGKIRLEWVDAAFQGDESIMAAVAAQAAANQGMYWEYHQALVDAGEVSGHAAFPNEKLIELAKEIGIPDMEAFELYLNDEDSLAPVAEDRDLTAYLGVDSTPAFIIGGQGFVGLQPLETFKQVIESELSLAEK